MSINDSPQIPILTSLISDVNDLKHDCENLYGRILDIDNGEGSRIVNEDERKANEVIRKTNEVIRQQKIDEFSTSLETNAKHTKGRINIYEYEHLAETIPPLTTKNWTNALKEIIKINTDKKTVFCPSGEYDVDGIDFTNAIIIEGEGKNSTIFNVSSTLKLSQQNIILKDIRIRSKNSQNDGVIIDDNFISLNNVIIENFTNGNGLKINPNHWVIDVSDCNFVGNKNGVDCVSTGDLAQLNTVSFNKCRMWMNLENGINFGGSAIKIRDCNIEGNGQYGVYVNALYNNVVSSVINDNYFEANKKGNIYIDINPTVNKNKGIIGLEIENNLLSCYDTLTPISGYACIKANTNVDGYGVFGLKIGGNNKFFSNVNSIWVDLGNTCSLNANIGVIEIECSDIGLTYNYNSKYINLGVAKIKTYHKLKCVNGFESNPRSIYEYSSDLLSKNIKDEFNVSTSKYIYNLNINEKSTIERLNIYVATDSQNYNVNFRIYEINVLDSTKTTVISIDTTTNKGNKLISTTLSTPFTTDDTKIYMLEIYGYIFDKDTISTFKLGHPSLRIY